MMLVSDFQWYLKELEQYPFLCISMIFVLLWMSFHVIRALIFVYNRCFSYLYCCCLMNTNVFRSTFALQTKQTKLLARLKYFQLQAFLVKTELFQSMDYRSWLVASVPCYFLFIMAQVVGRLTWATMPLRKGGAGVQGVSRPAGRVFLIVEHSQTRLVFLLEFFHSKTFWWRLSKIKHLLNHLPYENCGQHSSGHLLNSQPHYLCVH